MMKKVLAIMLVSMFLLTINASAIKVETDKIDISNESNEQILGKNAFYMFPNRDGTFKEFGRPKNVAHWDLVDDPVENPDDHETTISDDCVDWGPGASYKPIDTFFITQPDEEKKGKINSLSVHVRVKNPAYENDWPAHDYYIYPIVCINGQIYSRESYKTPAEYETFEYTWKINPNTRQKWAWSDLEDLEIGVKLNHGTGCVWNQHITQIYASVKYTKSRECPAVTSLIQRLMDLFPNLLEFLDQIPSL